MKPGQTLRLPRARAGRPGRGAAVRPGQGAARPVRPRRRRPEGLHARGRPPAGRQRRDRDEERGRGLRPPTTGRATPRCGCRRPGRSSTRCTSAGSPATPTPGVKEQIRGTYAGLIEKIPYLQGPRRHGGRAAAGPRVRRPGLPARAGQLLGLPAGLVLRPAPARTARGRDPLGPVDEFRDMVKALHRAGIEVILDVVFNHTAEGDHDGPTLCFRGIDNPTYYILEAGRRAVRGLLRLRQHAQRQPPGRPPDDRGQPAVLGDRDARGRVPVRPRVDPVARLARPRRCRTRRCCGTSSRTRRWPAPS